MAGDQQPVRVLSLEGNVDSHFETVLNLEEVLDSIVLHSSVPAVVDLARVTYIGSAGWQVFMSKAQECLENHCCLRVAGMQRGVLGVFTMIGLGEITEVHDTVDEAITAALGAQVAS
jgi:anti-anti-sigma factor